MKKQSWYMMLSTEGALRPEFTLDLSDPERLWWLEQCIRLNEEREEKMAQARARR